MKLFVAAIPYDFDDVDLKEMFELYGEVSSAKVIMDRETGKSRGFGFVDMVEEADAKSAIEALDGVSMKGKQMAVKPAEDNRGGGSPSRDFKSRDNRGSRPPYPRRDRGF